MSAFDFCIRIYVLISQVFHDFLLFLLSKPSKSSLRKLNEEFSHNIREEIFKNSKYCLR
jgi:hypothetical protein